VSTVTTVLPIPPINTEIVPNQELINAINAESIYLSKIQEISQLYGQEMYNNIMSYSDLIYLIKTFTIEQITASNFNEIILLYINCFNG
jgi:hypothetical protein